jgi:hypothetical protein
LRGISIGPDSVRQIAIDEVRAEAEQVLDDLAFAALHGLVQTGWCSFRHGSAERQQCQLIISIRHQFLERSA